MVLFLAILAIAAAYFFRLDFPYRWTDDAYVHGNEIFLVPRVTGTVVTINADDTDLVQKGQPLVVLDDSDAKVALMEAEGALGNTIRKVCQLYVNVVELKANVEARKTELSRAEDDYHRRTTAQAGLVSIEDITHARQAVDSARDLLEAAKQELGAAQALVANTDLEHHPMVLQVEANVLDADLAFQRTTVHAPETGYIVQRNVEVGQRVTPDTPMLAIIPLNQIWVAANFKEKELRFVRIGQPVSLKSDFYGDFVEYKGHVAGLAPSTGAAFSLLPPDEGSGNWIKIVQRVPVRIVLDDQQLEKYPLRIGLSMRVTIDTKDHSGAALTQAPSTQPVYATDIYSNEWIQANELLQGLVATNLQALSNLASDSTAKNVPVYNQMEMTHE
ncbi:MAG: efflux RND transporter periplasmic adaptor subunit [Verrucomicrobiota bacterium]|jgi:membrane fusion protein (multidrug efflux system)